MKKRIIALLICSCLLFLLAACGQPDNIFIGKWKVVKVESVVGGYPIEPIHTDVTDTFIALGGTDDLGSAEFKNGGEAKVDLEGKTTNTTWEYNPEENEFLLEALEAKEVGGELENYQFFYDKDTDTLTVNSSYQSGFYYQYTLERQ